MLSPPYTTSAREGGRNDQKPIKIYFGAQVICKIYSEPLGSYSEPLNVVTNPALFSSAVVF